MSIAEQQRQRTLALRDAGVEVRDPRAATQQVHYQAKDAPQIPEWDAENAIRQGYYANVIAYRCVQIRARAVASLPFRAGKDLEKRTEWDSRAPLALKLGPAPNGPAPKLSARKLLAWTFAQKIVTGRFAWELEHLPGGGLNFWPLCSPNLKAIPTDSGSEWFRAFTYGRPEKPVKLSTDDVFYDWTPGQADFRQPESPLQASRYDLSIAVMGDRFGYAFLRNGGIPATMVITEAFPTGDQYKRFKQNWRGNYQGPDNAGRTHFVEADPDRPDGSALADAISVQILGTPQKDAQFIQQHRASLEMIAISLGVPWSKLDASGRTFDNAKQEDKDFWHDTILNDITDFEDAVNMDLAPRLGTDAGWFDLSNVEALKPEQKFKTFDVPWMIDNGIILPNEFRSEIGLESLPELDSWEPLTLPAPKVIEAPAPPADVVPPMMPPPEPPPVARTRSAQSVEIRRAAQWLSADSQIRTMESMWARAWQRFFAKQEKSVLSALGGKRGVKMLRDAAPQVDPSQVFNKGYWQDQTEEFTHDLYATVAGAGGAAVAAKFGTSFSVTSQVAQDFIKARANQLAGQVTDTTYSEIQRVLAEGVAKGASVDDLAASVREVFSAASELRSRTIARTEVVSAFNGSSQLAASELPQDVVGGQEWIATRDGRTREDHADADGQAVQIGEPFSVGGEDLLYPGDPDGDPGNTINCRCTVGFLTPEEMADSGDTERSVPVGIARAVLGMVPLGPVDELAVRRALQTGRVA